MVKGDRVVEGEKKDSLRELNTILAEGKKVNEQIDIDLRQIMARTDELIYLITRREAA